MAHTLKRLLKWPYEACCALLFDPRDVLRKLCGLPFFAANLVRYARRNRQTAFRLRLTQLQYASGDRFLPGGATRGHYFHQDLWAARVVYERGIRELTDIGSRLDGFVAHVLPFCSVRYVDIRPLPAQVEGLEYIRGSVTALPFANDSIAALSCLHVIEHVGLGRYGDPVSPDGHTEAAKELVRVLKPGGLLLLGTPVGKQRLCFDAHRVFDPQTAVEAFQGLRLEEFALIDDAGQGIARNASFEAARQCSFGCGLFVFTKPCPEARADSGGAKCRP